MTPIAPGPDGLGSPPALPEDSGPDRAERPDRWLPPTIAPGVWRGDPGLAPAAVPGGAPADPGPHRGPQPGPDAEPQLGPDPEQAPAQVVERAHPLTPLVRGWLFLLAMGGWFLKDMLPTASRPDQPLPVQAFDPLVVVAGLVALAVLVGLGGLVTWLTTRFVADPSELKVETGWLFRQSNRIAYSRIQSVDVVQPLAARLLGLAEVRIDVGGEGATKLQFLTRSRANELRHYLMQRAHGRQVTVAESNAAAATGVLDDLGAADHVLIRVPPQDLVVGALLSHELLFIVLGFLVPAGLVVAVAAALATLTGEEIPSLGVVAGVGLLFPMAMAVFSFLSKRVIGQFNYTLAQTRAGLRISRGLTSLTSQSVPANRIQSIRLAQPILWRLIGRYRLDIEVLGYGHQTSDEDQSGTSTILLPIGTRAMVDTALHAVWPGLRLDRIQFRQTPERSKVLDPLAYGWLGYGLDDQVVVTRTGWLTRLQSIVPHARLQSVRLTQGPWERRLDLANLEFHTTGLLRTHGVQHIDAAEARRLLYDEADRAKTARTGELVGALLTAPDPARPSEPAGPAESVAPPEPVRPGGESVRPDRSGRPEQLSAVPPTPA